MPSTLDAQTPGFQCTSSTPALRQHMLVILLLSIVFSPFHLSAQVPLLVDTNEVQLSEINHYKNIVSKCEFWASPRLVSPGELPQFSYIDSLPVYLQRGIDNSVVDQHIYLRFRAYNNSDSVRQMYFFPAIHYKEIELYKGEISRVVSLPDTGRPKFADSSGYRFILFEPREHATVYARIKPVRTHTNFFRAYLVSAPDVQIWRAYFKGIENDSKIFGFIIAGMLLMMIFYATINFLQSFQLEFIYYSIYASFLGLLFFLYALHGRSSTSFNYFLESYFDLALQLTAHFFYCLFLQRFLETSANLPRLHKLLRFSQVLIVVGLLIYTYAYYAGMPFKTLNQIENISKYFLLGLGIIIVITGLIKKNKLLNYIMLGNLFLMLMSVFSLLFAVFDWQPFPAGSLFNRSLILYESGIVIELIFFLTGLSFKNRHELIVRTAEREKLKMENERKELDKQIAILQAQKEERSRISVDMHDELGSGMTAIRLMSELALNKMKDARIPELEKISSSANDLLVKMNAIIWSMSQANDSLANLLTYIRFYSLEYFENTSIQCMVNLPEEIPVKEMSGEKRRNTFLTVKETLNNTLKHSRASAVQINVSLNGALEICIQDNGTGIEMAKVGPFGNGLRNMKKRIESIGGLYQISRNDGTLTVLQIPL